MLRQILRKCCVANNARTNFPSNTCILLHLAIWLYVSSNKPITFSTILLFTNLNFRFALSFYLFRFCCSMDGGCATVAHTSWSCILELRRWLRDGAAEHTKIHTTILYKLYGRFVVRRKHYRVTESSGSIPLFSSVCTLQCSDRERAHTYNEIDWGQPKRWKTKRKKINKEEWK